jgi:hypothetical protein
LGGEEQSDAAIASHDEESGPSVPEDQEAASEIGDRRRAPEDGEGPRAPESGSRSAPPPEFGEPSDEESPERP